MKLVVVGLGVTGVAVVRAATLHQAELSSLGGRPGRGDARSVSVGTQPPEIVVVEDRPGTRGYADRVRVVRSLGALVVETPTAAQLASLADDADLIVPSPGVAADHAIYDVARRSSSPLVSEIELAARIAARRAIPLVAVTGTNGKTTVTTLIVEMLKASGVAACPAGNIGRPLIEAVDDLVDVIVAEVSSFQLSFTETFRPHVGVLLNVAEDHLDWHPSMERYVAAKQRLFVNQAGDDLLVFNADDPVVSRVAADAPARSVGCSLGPRAGGHRVVEGRMVTPDGGVLLAIGELSQSAPHDLLNALMAATAASDIGGSPEGITKALRSFVGLPHRLTFVGEAGGVKFYDDSKATNPHAAIHAIAAFPSVVLIAGGQNKGLDLGVLGQTADHVRAVVAIGGAADEVAAAFEGLRPTVRASSMREAVEEAAAFAHPGDVVLLSPACASFDWYSSYAERGDDFAQAVRRLLGTAGERS